MGAACVQKVFFDTKIPLLELLRSILKDPNSLHEYKLPQLHWKAAHLDDSNFITHDVVSLIRYSRHKAIDTLYAVDTLELLNLNAQMAARKFPTTLTGINQGFWGRSNGKLVAHPDAEWFLTMSCQVSFIFPLNFPLPFLVMRDAGGCSTILGPENFIGFIVGRSKRTWWKGVPHDGLSVEGQRVRLTPIRQGRWPATEPLLKG